jgi:hypothetical protein
MKIASADWEVVRKASNINGRSDKTARAAALSIKTKFQFVGMACELLLIAAVLALNLLHRQNCNSAPS